jgi:hypothetical protein
MRIKMRTLASGPEGHIHPGTILELNEKEAKELIAGGYAELAVEADDAERAVQLDDAETETTDKPHTAEHHGRPKHRK